jgi:Predicted membrane protein (DUF2142)
VRRTPAIWVLTSCVGALWALAIPPYAQPDERAHVIRAYAAARGHLVGAELDARTRAEWYAQTRGRVRPKTSSLVSVRTPMAFASAQQYRSCFARRRRVTPAECPQLSASTREVDGFTWQGRSPPMVHLVLGTATFFRLDTVAMYVMRVMSAVLCAALVAMAAVSVRRVGRAASAGLLVALTPMGLGLFGSATPSGIEIAAGIATWASLCALLSRVDVTDAAIDRAGVASLLLILARPIGLVWLAIIVMLTVLWSGDPRWLLGVRRARAWAAALGVAAISAIGWLLYAQTLSTAHNTNGGVDIPRWDAFVRTFDQTGLFYRQMIGVFDSDRTTFAPPVTIALWTAGIVVLFGLVFMSRRLRVGHVLAIFALVACVVLIPVALQGSSARGAWNWWRGRYTLPLAAGLPILIGATIAQQRLRLLRRSAYVIAGALVVAHVAAFWVVLRRYTAGADRSWSFFEDIRWHPPLNAAVLVVLYAVSIAALYVVVAFGNGWREEPVSASMSNAKPAEPLRARAP